MIQMDDIGILQMRLLQSANVSLLPLPGPWPLASTLPPCISASLHTTSGRCTGRPGHGHRFGSRSMRPPLSTEQLSITAGAVGLQCSGSCRTINSGNSAYPVIGPAQTTGRCPAVNGPRDRFSAGRQLLAPANSHARPEAVGRRNGFRVKKQTVAVPEIVPKLAACGQEAQSRPRAKLQRADRLRAFRQTAVERPSRLQRSQLGERVRLRRSPLVILQRLTA